MSQNSNTINSNTFHGRQMTQKFRVTTNSDIEQVEACSFGVMCSRKKLGPKQAKEEISTLVLQRAMNKIQSKGLDEIMLLRVEQPALNSQGVQTNIVNSPDLSNRLLASSLNNTKRSELQLITNQIDVKFEYGAVEDLEPVCLECADLVKFVH